MSQKAMHWYVGKLWQFKLGREQGCPAVWCGELEEGTKYRVKLPILKQEKE